jgi:hypothetical protein
LQGPDAGHHHHPPRLSRIAVALIALAAAPAASAAQPRFAALPSPVAPLSQQPPLGGGALSSTERVRHRVDATTTVRVAVDAAGTPFAVTATQRLDVRVTGDYFFTIGAPATTAEAAPGSQSTPGLRANAIVWAGFVPGRRILAARATLDTNAVAQVLPLRIERRGSTTLLTNATGASVAAYTADATRAPLRAYVRALVRDVGRGVPPTGGGAYITTPPRQVRVRVVAPLMVRGTVGSTPVDELVTGTAVVHAVGPLHLTVEPAFTPPRRQPASGRALLDLATRLTLTAARLRQYESFLGNPDPTGANRTTYVYRTAERPHVVATARSARHGHGWWTTLAVAAGLVVAAFAGLVVWARS